MDTEKYDYYKKVKIPAILDNVFCPKCNSELGAIHPDRIWCTNNKCSYAELHLTGDGTKNLKFKLITI